MFAAIAGIFLTSLVTWLVLAGYFAVAEGWSRAVFIPVHYLISLVATGGLFFTYLKFFPKFSPFWTMITAMIFLFIIELVVFNFFYKNELWFLNFVDWMVPVFIISATIYGVAFFLS